MGIHIQLDNYQLVRDKTTLLPKYVGFNVLLETDEGVGVLMCDWRLQDGLLYPPWKRTGPRGFFTHTYVSETVARMVREQAVADLTVMQADDPEIPVLDMPDGWKPSVYSPTNFKKMMPVLYKEKYSEEAPPRVEGHKRALTKPSAPAPTPLPPKKSLVKKFTDERPYFEDWRDMNDERLRPDYIPEGTRFVGPDDKRLHWGAQEWALYQDRKSNMINGVQ
jgi:hypothetical protein